MSRRDALLELTKALALAALLAQVAACATAPAAAAPPPSGEGALAAGAAGACPAARPGEDDLAVLLWEQRTRTAEEVRRATSEVALSPEAFAGDLGGPVLAGRPRTRALIDQVLRRAGPLYRAVKDRCARTRPYLADERVKPAVPPEESFSFPSGHATRGELMGRVLAELVPARAEALRERGRQIGYDRVRGGVHYPSDVLAGQRVADALADAWLADPAMRARLDEVRAAEWGGAGSSGATP